MSVVVDDDMTGEDGADELGAYQVMARIGCAVNGCEWRKSAPYRVCVNCHRMERYVSGGLGLASWQPLPHPSALLIQEVLEMGTPGGRGTTVGEILELQEWDSAREP